MNKILKKKFKTTENKSLEGQTFVQSHMWINDRGGQDYMLLPSGFSWMKSGPQRSPQRGHFWGRGVTQATLLLTAISEQMVRGSGVIKA